VGNHDNLPRVSLGVDDYLKEEGVTDVCRVDTNGHDTAGMSQSVYLFAQRLFKQ
jgi:hypothetical protein